MTEVPIEPWLADIDFERQGPLRRLLKKFLINPVANYCPASVMKGLLKFGKSELAAANWANPGGWRSMLISYEGHPRKVADQILVGAGTIPMALRNRRKLAGRMLVKLIEESHKDHTDVLCLGAGPGCIIADALQQCPGKATATLVDINSDAFEYGRELSRKLGIEQHVRFIVADARDIHKVLDRPPDIVKMLGLCEYLTDEQIAGIVSAAAGVMASGSAILTNSISRAHGTDRFFRNVFGLHMNHRSPRQLQDLLAPAGFGDFISIPEPLGVYHIIVGRRVAKLEARNPKSETISKP